MTSESLADIARLSGADNEIDYYCLIGYWAGCPGYLGQRRPLKEALLIAMRRSRFDFQTPASLGREVYAEEDVVRNALLEMDEVRRPVIIGRRYDDWFRLKSRGLTRQEKWARWRAIFTFSRMRDDF